MRVHPLRGPPDLVVRCVSIIVASLLLPLTVVMRVPGLFTSFVRLSVPLQAVKVQLSGLPLHSSASPSALWAADQRHIPLSPASSDQEVDESPLSSSKAAMADERRRMIDMCPKVVVFGRPGAGKTTIANAAVDLLLDNNHGENVENDNVPSIGLDLDVCVPQWMKDNFAGGIYPTLKQRQDFAVTCCDYVETELTRQISTKTTARNKTMVATVISFSFVNTDLRDVFRSRFPDAVWALVDTSEEQANIRIQTRQDHFYKGEQTTAQKDPEQPTEAQQLQEKNGDDGGDDVDNSEWKFAPVTFPHTILDGAESIDVNAKKVADIVLLELAKKRKTL